MCGIFGAVSLSGAPLRHAERLAAMAAALAHRGPDGAVWMVCNGEIYNAAELRQGGERAGYPFRSKGDIETIVPLYARQGADGVARLEGMFGLAIWDDARRRLVLARDRAGEKPLFWTRIGDELRFASEVQALLVFPDQRRRVSPTAAALYTAMGYVPAPQTMLDGIHKLPPGYLLIAEAGSVTVRPYWDPAAAAAAPSTLESAEQLRETLLGAVARELMSDVPLGIFTSGGLDSSFLVAAAARAMPGERLHTYAVRFTEPGYDESAFAEQVTHDIRSVHHVVTADDVALRRALDVVTEHLAEPVGDPALLPTYLLAEEARTDVKVVLSGEGADELFGGYPTYLGHRAALAWQRLPRALRSVLRGAITRLPASTGKVTLEFMLKQFVAAADRPLLERHLAWFGALGPDVDDVDEVATKLRGFPEGDPLNRVLWLDFVTYLPDNLLVKVDRGTMLASIEARAPFLDRRVLELVLPAPSALKVRGFTTKAILKQAARGLVPANVIRRRKRGLSVPVARFLNAGLAPLADRYLAAPHLAPDRVRPLLAEHRAGRANHARKLWPVLMAELWAERWHVDMDPLRVG